MSFCILWWRLGDCIGLLLHATQSFATFCLRKISAHYAPRYFGVPFRYRFTSAYAKSSELLENANRILGGSHQALTLQNKIHDNKSHRVFYGGG